MQYYLSSLKQKGLIKKIGYGVWETSTNINPQEVQKTTRLTHINPQQICTSFAPDTVRAHAFQFTFEVPENLRNWDKRKEILQKLGISFKELKVFGGGEQIEFKGRKVWLTNKSIIIFEKASYLAETAEQAKSYAVAEALETIKAFEHHIQANLGRYRFKVSRQHYALIKNALAKQYDKEGNKLYVASEQGSFWFIIDNSFNLHEAETIHPKTAVQDNKKIQDFFNGVKQLEGFTPQFVVNSLGIQAQNIENYAVHLKSHVKSVQDLGAAVLELVKVVKELRQ
ncbi:MAG: hypothetical protein FJZ63_02110 [Chlamydiae bacterium]|nr:hypothetical protein [Chlamydiota bacterium]